jgi:N-acetylglucosaminyl-diphospho-decaprenol L-rhamnosyltransferase
MLRLRAITPRVDLSVVLVNHNGAACLRQTLAALARNTATEQVECIVVDSGSSDGSWEGVAEAWPRARALRFEENVGFCVGCNRGAEAASGRLLAFVNFDGEVEPGWDMPLAALLDDPTVSIATGLLLSSDGEVIQAAGLAIAPNTAVVGRLDMLPRSAAPSEPIDVPAATGALMMVRREEFLDLGGFYEPFFMYGEEADYCLRVQGRIVLHPDSAMRHEYGHASGPQRSVTRLYWGSRNRLINAARHLPPASLAKSVVASLGFDVLTLAQLRTRAAAGAIAHGWLDGVRQMHRERAARTSEERRRATRSLMSMWEAIAEQRRLGRL